MMDKMDKMGEMPMDKLAEGFKFTLTPDVVKNLDLGEYQVGHECSFMVKADLIKNDTGSLTFQAVKIKKMDDMDAQEMKGEMPKGVGKMYKQAMAPNYDLKKDKNKIQYVKPSIQPAAG